MCKTYAISILIASLAKVTWSVIGLKNHVVQAIAQAAKALVEQRDNWLNPPGATEQQLKPRTLTNLYNQKPTWLQLTHRQLDRAVLAAYDAVDEQHPRPADLSDEQILAQLLALNLRRAKIR